MMTCEEELQSLREHVQRIEKEARVMRDELTQLRIVIARSKPAYDVRTDIRELKAVPPSIW